MKPTIETAIRTLMIMCIDILSGEIIYNESKKLCRIYRKGVK